MVAPNPKRPKPADSDVEELEIDETYHITAVLHSKYAIFSINLRWPLQKCYVNAMRTQMKIFLEMALPKSSQMYSVIAELRTRKSTPLVEKNIISRKDNIPSEDLANTALMEMFWEGKKAYLTKEKRPVFVELKPEGKVVNPEFTRFHCVRRNEIGWGFDSLGCLTLHMVFMENATKLCEYDIYVQRMDIEVKEKG